MVHGGLQKLQKQMAKKNHTPTHNQPRGQEISPGGFIQNDEIRKGRGSISLTELRQELKGTTNEEFACRERGRGREQELEKGAKLEQVVGCKAGSLGGLEVYQDQVPSTALI